MGHLFCGIKLTVRRWLCRHTPSWKAESCRSARGQGGSYPLGLLPESLARDAARTHRGRGTGCRAGPTRAAPRELGHPGVCAARHTRQPQLTAFLPFLPLTGLPPSPASLGRASQRKERFLALIKGFHSLPSGRWGGPHSGWRRHCDARTCCLRNAGPLRIPDTPTTHHTISENSPNRPEACPQQLSQEKRNKQPMVWSRARGAQTLPLRPEGHGVPISSGHSRSVRTSCPHQPLH